VPGITNDDNIAERGIVLRRIASVTLHASRGVTVTCAGWRASGTGLQARYQFFNRDARAAEEAISRGSRRGIATNGGTRGSHGIMVRIAAGCCVCEAVRLALPNGQGANHVGRASRYARLDVNHSHTREVNRSRVANLTSHSKRTANVSHDRARAGFGYAKARGRAYHTEAARSAVGDCLRRITKVHSCSGNRVHDVTSAAQAGIDSEVRAPGSSGPCCERAQGQNRGASQVISKHYVGQCNVAAIADDTTKTNCSWVAIAQEN
jgi:hypothetical protein